MTIINISLALAELVAIPLTPPPSVYQRVELLSPLGRHRKIPVIRVSEALRMNGVRKCMEQARKMGCSAGLIGSIASAGESQIIGQKSCSTTDVA